MVLCSPKEAKIARRPPAQAQRTAAPTWGLIQGPSSAAAGTSKPEACARRTFASRKAR
jgi:hypothetical protein